MLRFYRSLIVFGCLFSLPSFASARWCSFQLRNCTFSCVDDLACWDACNVAYEECVAQSTPPSLATAELSSPDLCAATQASLNAIDTRIASLQAALRRAAPADKAEIADQIQQLQIKRANVAAALVEACA